MRTTLIIDDDVMFLARDLAKAEHRPISAIMSDLAREGYRARREAEAQNGESAGSQRFGMLPDRGVVVTNEQVNALREQLGI